jgi:CheY-like chemotaxis protein
MAADEAESGPEALKILRAATGREEPYDLAIVDLEMPGMDGMGLAREIGRDSSIAPIRLVPLTSVGAPARAERAHRAGFAAHLGKPVRQRALYERLIEVARKPVEEVAAPSPASLAPDTPIARERPHARILVVEDNPVNQKVATMILKRLGYGIEVAKDGLEALDALDQETYAAIFMDVQMPGMGGYEATREIRRREGALGRHTPIIAMTANAMSGDREKALEAGMDDYVPKPVKPDLLKDVLARWVSPDRSLDGKNPAAHDDLGSLEQNLLEQDLLGTPVLDRLRGVQQP